MCLNERNFKERKRGKSAIMGSLAYASGYGLIRRTKYFALF